MRIVEKIQEVLDSKNIKASKMMKDLGFSSGLFSQWKAGKQQVSLDKIVGIADYFEVSVDYLLGRTDNPNGCSGDQITIGDIDGNYNMTVGKGETKPLKIDGLSKEMLEKFECLDFEKKIEVMTLISNLSKK